MARPPNTYRNPTGDGGTSLARAIFGEPAAVAEQAKAFDHAPDIPMANIQAGASRYVQSAGGYYDPHP